MTDREALGEIATCAGNMAHDGCTDLAVWAADAQDGELDALIETARFALIRVRDRAYAVGVERAAAR